MPNGTQNKSFSMLYCCSLKVNEDFLCQNDTQNMSFNMLFSQILISKQGLVQKYNPQTNRIVEKVSRFFIEYIYGCFWYPKCDPRVSLPIQTMTLTPLFMCHTCLQYGT